MIIAQMRSLGHRKERGLLQGHRTGTSLQLGLCAHYTLTNSVLFCKKPALTTGGESS